METRNSALADSLGGESAAPSPAVREDRPATPGRLGQADLVRAVAAVMVVAIHCLAWPAQATGLAHLVYPAVGLLARVSVPLFVMLSGLLLAHSHPQPGPAKHFWAGRLRRTLVPWVLWAGVYFLLTVRFQGMSPLPAQSWGWWAGGAGHLYFLILIPQLYLLYRVWPRSEWGAWLAMTLAVAVQLGMQFARIMLPLHGGWGRALFLDYGFEEAPFWVGYFGIGVALGRSVERIRWRGPLVWLAAALTAPAAALLLAGLPGKVAAHWGPWVNGTGAFLRPSLLLLTTLVFVDLWALGTVLERWVGPLVQQGVRSLSRNSLGVYIIHPAFLLASGPLLEGAPRPLSLQEPLPESLLPLSVLVATATSLGWASSEVLGRWPLSRWTVGLGR